MEAGLGAEPCCCRTCGSLEMSAAEPAVVLVITVDYRFTISVPRFTCAEEGCPGTFAPSPFAAGCFPATPCVSWDVSQATQQHPARWFDMRLMQLGDALMYGVRRAVAAHSLANVVLTQHELNGCGGERINLDHLKRQLSDTIVVRGVGGSMDGSGRGDQVHAATHRALTPPPPPPQHTQEYGYLMCTLMHLVNLGVHEEGPLPLADCPACAGAPDAHLNIDFCFGITTLANCAAATTRGMDPPNTRVFMDVGTSVAQLQQGVVAPNQAAADADHACSEFNAATALARKSDKVRFWRTHPHCWAHPCAACPRWPSSPSALCPRSLPQHDTRWLRTMPHSLFHLVCVTGHAQAAAMVA